jgi:competence protein ComGC
MAEETAKVVATRNWKLIIIVIVAIIIALVPSIYFYSKYQSAVQNAGINKEQTANYVSNLKKLIEIPADENPSSVATVTDVTKLTGEPFFASAKNGDVMFVFDRVNKAILYRPSENKIINVLPVNIAPNVAQPAQQAQPTGSAQKANVSPTLTLTPTPTVAPKKVSVLILNGTKTAGLAATAEKRITDKLPQAQITKGNSQGDYAKTVIVDSSNNSIDSQLVSLIGGSVVKTMPTGENASSTDITIILGADFK